ncbi:MAG: hypothetical protein WBI12_13615 [Methanosarcina flavescens]|nr:hypothetical protein [Methanosarcina flavescens]NLK32926.1 hypothetical protein [Methanosarcina flavescens]
MKNQNLDIITVEGELNRINEDLMKLLKIALVELKYINSGIKKPIVERPTCRIKSLESICNKISKKEELNCKNFTVKMNDLLGIRVICSNLSSLDEVWRKLYFSESLKFYEIGIRLEDSADGYPEIDFSKFDPNIVRIEKPVDGYRGIHLIFSAKENILSNPGLKGKIQLRTIAQHYWATFSHDDIYKENPYLENDEQKQLICLSNKLYDIDKNFSSLGFDLKANPLEINKKILYSLFNEFGFHFDNEDVDKLIDLIFKHRLVSLDLTDHRIRVKDYGKYQKCAFFREK